MKPVLNVMQSKNAVFGLPCAMKILGFFVGNLEKYAAELGQSARNKNVGTPRSPSPLGDSSLDSDTVELLLSLKAIHAMLLAEGDMSKSRAVIMSCPPLASMVRDDLAKCLLMISAKREFPPSVLQCILSIFGTLITSVGPSMRIMIECFLVHVYMKGLTQVYDMLVTKGEYLNSDDESVRASITTASAKLFRSGFSIEELGMILESLADLLLARGFLQSLYATFDCDPTKADLVQPLLGYLSKCTKLALLFEMQDLGSLQDLASLCVQTFLQVTKLLADRCGVDEGNNETDLCVSDSDISEETKDSAKRRSPAASMSKLSDLEKQASSVAEYLIALRKSKDMLHQAAALFMQKPELGLKYLQDQKALPTPLTPESVAKFLRIAPGLSKECVGSFLGELGKDSPKFEADAKIFHEKVLLAYVRSFKLNGQSVLNSMRIFLSAFPYTSLHGPPDSTPFSPIHPPPPPPFHRPLNPPPPPHRPERSAGTGPRMRRRCGCRRRARRRRGGRGREEQSAGCRWRWRRWGYKHTNTHQV